MRVFLIASVAVAVSGAAFAKDLKGSVMTDVEMDKVTAGAPGLGFNTSIPASNEKAFNGFVNGVSGNPGTGQTPGSSGPGFGMCTAGLRNDCGISDIRLKRDIVQVSRLDNGLGLYRDRYKWSDQVYVGVMAQEVALVRPDAVIQGTDGYLRVDYSRLGLRLMTWDEWAASGEKALKQTKAMSDSEMDKVTAGRAFASTPGPGISVVLPVQQGGSANPAGGTANFHASGNSAFLTRF